MRILHYNLGLPPYRTGGLTKYSVDLMENQANNGHQVVLLYPGKIKLLNNKIKIVPNDDYNKIKVYEIYNPLPVSLLYGVKEIDKYTKNCDISVFYKFLEEINVDCIHIHTFMGLPKEFLIAARNLKIRVLYTSHDYFGICPKCSLFNANNKICDGYNNEGCSQCSENALNYKKIIILQSHIYKKIKNSRIIRKIRNKEKNKINPNISQIKNVVTHDYDKLKEYYYSMYSYIDIFHFNSKTSYEVFKKYIHVDNYEIIPITHLDIKDRREEKDIKEENEAIIIGYLGAQTVAKGFHSIIHVFDELQENKIKLSIYFKPDIEREYLNTNEKYDYSQLDKVLKSNDIVIVPSLWKETFGFVVLEALSYGVPVIVSDNVGAKDLVKNGMTGYIYKNEEELKYIIKNLNGKEIKKLNMNILNDDTLEFDFNKHTEKIIELYQGEKNGRK